MKPHYLAFKDVVNRAQVDPTERARLIAASLGTVVAQSLPLPTSPVENPSSHYISTVLSLAGAKLGTHNEHLIFDYKAALEYTRIFWMLRYTAVHGGTPAFIGTDFCFLSKLMGADLYISANEYVYLNTYKNVLEILIRAAGQLLKVCDEQA